MTMKELKFNPKINSFQKYFEMTKIYFNKETVKLVDKSDLIDNEEFAIAIFGQDHPYTPSSLDYEDYLYFISFNGLYWNYYYNYEIPGDYFTPSDSSTEKSSDFNTFDECLLNLILSIKNFENYCDEDIPEEDFNNEY